MESQSKIIADGRSNNAAATIRASKAPAGVRTHDAAKQPRLHWRGRMRKQYRFGLPLLGAMALSLSACQFGDSDNQKLEQRAKDALASVLKDPHSAQYRNIAVLTDMASVCGEVNSKNSFGAYTGFRGFLMGPDGVAWVEGSDDGGYEMLSAICR